MRENSLAQPAPPLAKHLTHSERETMYNILTTIIATALIVFGSNNLDGGLLFKFALVIGGIYLGYVMTDALNKNNSDNV